MIKPVLLKLLLILLVAMGGKRGVYGAVKCHVWRDILPCECQLAQNRKIQIICEKMTSFNQVVDIINRHFHPHDRIYLRLAQSNLPDLQYRQFREINATIEDIRLNYVYLGKLEEKTFVDMSKVTYVSFADSSLDEIPGVIWKHMPYVQTLDLGRTRIKEIPHNSFEDFENLRTLVLAGNQISRIDRNSLPIQMERLHIGRNRIYNLNGTLLALTNLNWLFLNSNDFEDLEGQLPYEASNLKIIHASHNRLVRVPQLSHYPRLETLFLNNNEITFLGGAFAGCRALDRIDLSANQIYTLTANDFLECDFLDTLDLAYNQITALNNSLIPLKNLNTLNLQYNLLTEFSFNEIFGLENLRRLDLSYNQISTIIGPASNLVEPNIKLIELRLDHNSLEVLNAALSGLSELLRLNLSYNKLRRISPDDFINLDQLRLLDISHNQLKTLEEMSKTYLPRLSELKASHNQLTVLERDFHGLPVLCYANLSNNQIVALGRELVTKTRCKIEHGVHDGTWDTLKIILSDNPILCDAALPEITSEMETNHTKITGVSYCSPLNEQPITAKPNAFLGYIPEPIATVKTPYEPIQIANKVEHQEETPNQIEARNDHYQVDHFEGRPVEVVQQTPNDQPVTVSIYNSRIFPNQTENVTSQANVSNSISDSITQGQINKLALEIEELKTRLEDIIVQNERLLNKTITDQMNLTVKVP